MTGVAIMGLHRGGTSAVAGVIHALGFYMGDDLLPPSEHNPKGYFESYKMMKLHTAMMGGDTWNPEIDVEPYLDDYEHAIDSLNEHQNWAVKDPRLCYLWPYLNPFYDFLIVVIRSKEDAGASLFSRGGHTSRETTELTSAYAKKLYVSARNFTGDKRYVHYDALMVNPAFEISLLTEWLDVEYTEAALAAIDPTLRHWR